MVDKKTHRLLVMSNKGELKNVISQSRLVQMISNIVDYIPHLRLSLGELNLCSKSVVCVLESESTYEAFRIMKERHLAGIAVINSQGTLVANISLSDIKLLGFDANYWHLLSQPVTSYLRAIRAKPETKIRARMFTMLDDHTSPYPLVVKCKPYHSLAFIIKMLAYYKVHRIYVTDDMGSPLSVISLTDILQQLQKTM